MGTHFLMGEATVQQQGHLAAASKNNCPCKRQKLGAQGPPEPKTRQWLFSALEQRICCRGSLRARERGGGSRESVGGSENFGRKKNTATACSTAPRPYRGVASEGAGWAQGVGYSLYRVLTAARGVGRKGEQPSVLVPLRRRRVCHEVQLRIPNSNSPRSFLHNLSGYLTLHAVT